MRHRTMRLYTRDESFPYAARGLFFGLVGAISLYSLIGVVVWALMR